MMMMMMMIRKFLQRVSIAERCISYDRCYCPPVHLSVWLSVTRCMVSCQNDCSYDYAVFTGG